MKNYLAQAALLIVYISGFTLGVKHCEAKPKLKNFPIDVQKQNNLILSKTELLNKIKGGWAGQTIGVTYGGPMEFRYNGRMIPQDTTIPWYNGYLKKTMTENPGLYDDIYMDLTFVDVFEKEGLDAPISSFANAYANAGYMLWHANQVGRYNILHGISAPQSGHWLNNPHADCIDYQIEADFAGLMSPAMPNTASAISDKIGHIMNYGDGWYGGVYIGALYSLAFTSTNISYIVNDALKTIPEKSQYYQCISDVIRWHQQYPNDWKQTWLEVQKKWAFDIGCPDGVFKPLNIDAKVNSAYVIMALLYGNGDFTKTLDIATRCGQDADCNPSSAGGILGTILGYNKIPAYWKQGLTESESINFKYTSMSLNDVYRIGFKQALQNIARNGGRISGDKVIILKQNPKAVKFEQSFAGHYPESKKEINQPLKDEYSFDFEGIGFVITGSTGAWDLNSDYVFKAEVWLDGKLLETVELPANYTKRRYDLFWKYQLENTKHTIKLKLLNPSSEYTCQLNELLVYSNKPPSNIQPSNGK